MVMKVVEYKGKPGATFEQASTNTAAGLTAANLVDAQGNRANSALIQALDNTIKLAVNATPIAGASSGLGYEIQDTNFMTLEGSDAVFGALIISAVTDTHGRLQVTPFFG